MKFDLKKMMKKLFLGLGLMMMLLGGEVLALEIPEPVGFLNDFGGILAEDERVEIESWLSDFERETGNEIVVVIFESLEGENLEQLSIDLAEEWKVGKEGLDNGVIFLVVAGDREMRIEVGRGLEGAITDVQSKWLLDQVATPAFRDWDFKEGIFGVVEKLGEMAKGEFDEKQVEKSGGVNFRTWMILGFLTISWLGAILGRSKAWWPGGVLGGGAGTGIGWLGLGWEIWGILGLGVGIGMLGLLFDFLVSKNYASAKARGVHPAWWAGGMGRGGKGGSGFGGSFGGGIFSGGGASGRW